MLPLIWDEGRLCGMAVWDGRHKHVIDFKPVRTWRSARTNTSYPVSMDVRAGALTWRLDPLMDDQELDSRQSTGAVYWEGAVRVSREGQAVGRGYLELTGYANALRTGGH